jgi:glutamate synthase (NADPH/NADH) large chain
VVLGKTGRNFAAGMSGGIAYVYDIDGDFADKCNAEMVDLDPLDDGDLSVLKDLLSGHAQATGSSVASFLLSDLENQKNNFIKVFPRDYKKVLQNTKSSANVGIN